MLTLALLDPGALDAAAGRTLVELALKGAVVLLLAAIVTRSWRGASAAARHWVWTVSIASLLILPLLAAGVPEWRIPWSGKLVQAIAAQPPAESTMATTLPAAESVAPLPGALPNSTLTTSWSWQRQLATGWAAGAALLLGLLLIAHARTAMITRRARPLRNPQCTLLLARLCRRLGIPSAPRLIETGSDAMPMTWGVLHPVIGLPRGAVERWTEQRLEAVLVHELAHVRRRDILVQLMAQVACALHWFNPLAWFALRRVRLEGEKSCDDVVLDIGVKPSVYAEFLLGLARAQRGRRTPALASSPMAEPSQLPIRLRALLDEAQHRGRASLALLTVLLLAGVATAGAVAAATPAAPGDVTSQLVESSAGTSEAGHPRLSPIPGAATKYFHADEAVGGFAAPPAFSFSEPGRAVRLPLAAGDTTPPVLLNPAELDAAIERNYPATHRQAGVSGTALLELRIDGQGRVIDARAVNASDPAFGESASASLRTARFAPARAEEGPIAIRVLWPVAFNALGGSLDGLRYVRAARESEMDIARPEAVERALAAIATRAFRLSTAEGRLEEQRTAERRQRDLERQLAELASKAYAMAGTAQRATGRVRAAEAQAAAPHEAARERGAATERQLREQRMAVAQPVGSLEAATDQRRVEERQLREQRVAAELAERSMEAATEHRRIEERQIAEQLEMLRAAQAAALPRRSREIRVPERPEARAEPSVGEPPAAVAARLHEAAQRLRRQSCARMIQEAWQDRGAVERALREADPRRPVVVMEGRIATAAELRALGIRAEDALDGSESIGTRELLGVDVPGGVVCVYPAERVR